MTDVFIDKILIEYIHIKLNDLARKIRKLKWQWMSSVVYHGTLAVEQSDCKEKKAFHQMCCTTIHSEKLISWWWYELWLKRIYLKITPEYIYVVFKNCNIDNAVTTYNKFMLHSRTSYDKNVCLSLSHVRERRRCHIVRLCLHTI